jgi:hypothetical protein
MVAVFGWRVGGFSILEFRIPHFQFRSQNPE